MDKLYNSVIQGAKDFLSSTQKDEIGVSGRFSIFPPLNDEFSIVFHQLCETNFENEMGRPDHGNCYWRYHSPGMENCHGAHISCDNESRDFAAALEWISYIMKEKLVPLGHFAEGEVVWTHSTIDEHKVKKLEKIRITGIHISHKVVENPPAEFLPKRHLKHYFEVLNTKDGTHPMGERENKKRLIQGSNLLQYRKKTTQVKK